MSTDENMVRNNKFKGNPFSDIKTGPYVLAVSTCMQSKFILGETQKRKNVVVGSDIVASLSE